LPIKLYCGIQFTVPYILGGISWEILVKATELFGLAFDPSFTGFYFQPGITPLIKTALKLGGANYFPGKRGFFPGASFNSLAIIPRS